jgi:hypothetical protein
LNAKENVAGGIMKRGLPIFVLCLATCLIASASPEQSPQRKNKNEVTIQGCVGRMSGDYLLFQTDPGNSYVLEASRKIKLGDYLGQQVEVKGREWPTLSTSTNFTRRRAGSPVTIVVESINTVARECSTE